MPRVLSMLYISQTFAFLPYPERDQNFRSWRHPDLAKHGFCYFHMLKA